MPNVAEKQALKLEMEALQNEMVVFYVHWKDRTGQPSTKWKHYTAKSTHNNAVFAFMWTHPTSSCLPPFMQMQKFYGQLHMCMHNENHISEWWTHKDRETKVVTS